MERLTGKVALVTGASRGIGRGIALQLAADGADVVVNYRTHPEEAQETADAVAELGRRALAWQADVADRDAVRKMFDAAIAHFGHLDIAVANAAFSIREPVIEAQWEHVLRTIQVSQFGVFHTCQMAAQQMVKQHQQGRRGGKIAIISSVMEEICFPESAAYQMAKGAINCLGRTMASELARYQINVNVVNPGWIDTPGERQFYTEQELQERGKYIPWGRLGAPEDIARTVAFLVSDAADYVTGATLRVDGGFILGLRLGGEGGY
ncbi:MAG TPA: glucose 1-dehydrogenase [Anaerolineae bacterium]|nr:glucose 1-dehydrogenase [Anaerolineae bacterium]